MAVEIYIFDLDGVIINSGEDIADSVNASLKNFGYWNVDTQKIISFIGDGEKKLILRSLKESTKNKFDESTEYNKKQLEDIQKFYHEYYLSHCVVKTYLYAGIKELLRVLKKKKKYTVILSNKSVDCARFILNKLNVLSFFDLVIGGNSVDFNNNVIPLKPSVDGIQFAIDYINKVYNQNFINKNCILFGDSAQDIITGKKIGCLTVEIRGGLGNKEELYKQNADLSFSVASEIEKFIDTLSEDVQKNTIMIQAMKNEVPVIQDEGSNFICKYIKDNNVKSILEIGTAIGFSSIKFAKLSSKIKVTTIEIDENRFNEAQKNFNESGVKNQITSILGNALDTEIEGTFDLIFIDAAKAQYINFFEKFKNQLNENGVFISDNLSFHGMVDDLSLTRNYSTIKLVKKIRKYIEFLKNNTEFSTEFYKVGDGISISRRNKIVP